MKRMIVVVSLVVFASCGSPEPEPEINTPPVAIPFGKRMVQPTPTPEGELFIASLSGIADRDRLTAIGLYLREVCHQLLAIAAEHDPSIVPEQYRRNQEC